MSTQTNILTALPLPPVLGSSPLKEDRSVAVEQSYYQLQQKTGTIDNDTYLKVLKSVPTTVPYGVASHLKKT